jgi:DNA-binding FadR family transcriptional regulator
MYEGWTIHRVVRPSRLANAVVERLLLRILDGEFPPGSDLPPEAALATEFAVSRTILREALKGLEEKHVLRIRHGRGTTIRPRAEWNLLDPLVLAVQLEHGDPAQLSDDLAQVRVTVQRLMADLAASRATPEQRLELDAALRLMRAKLDDPVAHREALARFTATLAAAAGNQVARCVVETLDVPAGRAATEDDLREEIRRAQDIAESVYSRVMAGGTPSQPTMAQHVPDQAHGTSLGRDRETLPRDRGTMRTVAPSLR